MDHVLLFPTTLPKLVEGDACSRTRSPPLPVSLCLSLPLSVSLSVSVSSSVPACAERAPLIHEFVTHQVFVVAFLLRVIAFATYIRMHTFVTDLEEFVGVLL